MFSHISRQLQQIPEHQYARMRWLALLGWLLLIGLLLYDPISPLIMPKLMAIASENAAQSSSLALAQTATAQCVMYQADCVAMPPTYALGPSIFWGLIVPSSIFILLVFGHDTWRRICPLSLISQLPGKLGLQRHSAPSNGKQSGKAKAAKARKPRLMSQRSWLGQNYRYFQFGFLFLGLCARLWLIDSNRWALAAWLLLTMGLALGVGIAYGGKTWCNYFCPMAPVQRIYSSPGAILTAKASWSKFSQSVCRTTSRDQTGHWQEQRACVGCQRLCMDIDSEKTYWESLGNRAGRLGGDRQEKFIRYGYLGLVIGFFSYYYLCAGNWDFFFSGLWVQREASLASLWEPGFYIGGQAIAIPKLVAVPLTLGAATLITWQLGCYAERRYHRWSLSQGKASQGKASQGKGLQAHDPLHAPLDDAKRVANQVRQHHCFTLATFLAFNVFAIFAGRSWVAITPPAIQYLHHSTIVLASGFWLYNNWRRNPIQYHQENSVGKFQRQLTGFESEILATAHLDQLNALQPNQLAILAQVLPEIAQTQRNQIYREMLEQLYLHSPLDLLQVQSLTQAIRERLGISIAEHEALIPAPIHNASNLGNTSGLERRQLEHQQRQQAIQDALQQAIDEIYPEPVSYSRSSTQ